MKKQDKERLLIEYRDAEREWEESRGDNSEWLAARDRFYKAEATLKAAGIDPDDIG